MHKVSTKSPQAEFLRYLLYAIVGTVLFVSFLLYNRPDEKLGGAGEGQPLPKIEAIGWLNGEAPKPSELVGKVLVIDAWASWCLPCRKQAPELVFLQKKYRDKGVLFIGLTAEPESELEPIKHFLETTGITWLNGYGAEATLTELGAEAIPMVWVFDRRGKVVWNETSSISLDQGIALALASKAP